MTAFVILAHVQIARASGGLTEAGVVTDTSAVMRATDGALPYVAKTLVRRRTTGYHHHCGPRSGSSLSEVAFNLDCTSALLTRGMPICMAPLLGNICYSA